MAERRVVDVVGGGVGELPFKNLVFSTAFGTSLLREE